MVLSPTTWPAAPTLTSGDASNPDVLDIGETWIYIGDLRRRRRLTSMPAADLVNTASVVTTEVPGPTEDDATTTITQNPALTIAKDVDLTDITRTGHVDLHDHGDQHR